MPRTPKPPGTQIASTSLQVAGGVVRGRALVGGDPADVDLGLVREATGAQRLADREVGVGQVDVLADQRDRDLLLGVVHPAEQVVPDGPVDVAERQVEAAYDVGVEALAVQHLGDVVDRRRVRGGDHGLLVDVAHQRDLALDGVGQLAVGAADDGVRLDADLAQRGDRVLGGLGLQLTGRADVGHQRDVQEEDVAAADVVAHLARGLEERQRLDVADGAADLGDHDVDVGAAHGEDAFLDLVGDVRDHLHGVAEVVAAALLGDHARVDLPGRHVGDLAEVGVEEPLVVADVQVGLGAVVGDEHLAVLERVHRPRVDVQVGVELLHGHAETARLQKAAEARCRQALPERRGDAPGDEYVLGGRPVVHGTRSYVRGTAPAEPDAPKEPTGIGQRPDQGQRRGHLTERRVGPVDRADRLGRRVGAQRDQVAAGRAGGRVAGHHHPGRLRGQAGREPGEDRRVGVVAEDHEDDLGGLGVLGGVDELGTGEALADGLRVGSVAGRRQRQELTEPLVRRGARRRPRPRAGSSAGCRGCRRATSGRGR